MRKILFINTVPTDRNGITNVIFNYLSSDLGKYYQLDYLSINDIPDAYLDTINKSGGTSFVVSRSLKHVVGYINGLRRIIKDNHYEAVHIHGNSHTVVIELVAAYLSNCKVRIVHAHSTSSSSHLLHLVLTPLFNLLCTNRIACGNEAGKWMFGSHEYEVINNGINTSHFSFCEKSRNEIRNELKWDEKVVLAHVGEFSVNKNQVFLVELLKNLLCDNDSYRLLLIGEGEQRDVVNKKVNEYGLTGKVLFTGKIPNVSEYLNACDLILMPSFYEGFPVTLVEQQANGLKCVISETISKDVNITGNVAFVPSSVDKWVDLIKSLSVDSDKERQSRSRSSIDILKVQGYDFSSSSEKLKQIYDMSISKT